jgi:hypothetical protein
LQEIFRQDASLAHDWLIARAEAGPLTYHSLEIVQSAIEVLSFDEKRNVLDRLSLNPESADSELIKALTANDPRLLNLLLGRKKMSRNHLVALAGPPTGRWCEMAAIALDAGYSPDDVAKAAFGWVWQWEGDESAMWNKWARDFESVLGHEDSRLQAVGRPGLSLRAPVNSARWPRND